MTDRLNPEALRTVADVILRHCGGYVDTTPADAERAAKAVLRNLAALPAPRTITTVEELDALPVGAVVYAANHIGPAERFTEGWKGCGNAAAWPSAILARDGLPAHVLWVPTEGGGDAT